MLLRAGAGAIEIERMAGLAGSKPREVAAGQVFVRFSTGTPRAGRASAAAAAGAKVLGEFDSIGWTLVGLPPGMKVAEGLAWARGLAGALEAEPNGVLRPNKVPNDPLVSSQYALSKVNAFAAWEFDTGASAKVTVAVIDAGIQGTHSDLSSKFAGVSQFCNPDNSACAADNPPTHACNHGTRVAGVAAAATDNAGGIAGMSWGAQLLSYRVFRPADCDPDGGSCDAGACATTNAAVINAIDHARGLHGTAAIGKVVINLSLGDPTGCAAALQTAITNAVNAGLVVVVSAGNDGGSVMSPANCAGAIPVGATDSGDLVASFSSRGVQLANSGLVAPGVGILTTDINNGTAEPSGTSFSAPMVAGVAALIWSARPDFTPAQVQQTLRLSANGIGFASLGTRTQGETTGAGRLNAFRALRLAIRGTLSDFEGDKKAIAFPNPFRTARDGFVTIAYPPTLEGKDTVIRFYTASGELVRELRATTWDGKNDDGRLVASGAYFFVVSTEKGVTSGRVTVLR